MGCASPSWSPCAGTPSTLNTGVCMLAGSKAVPNQFIHCPGASYGLWRRFKREQEPASAFIFTSERGAPFTSAGFRKMIARLGVVASFDFPVHPHMLRHACGYHLANRGV